MNILPAIKRLKDSLALESNPDVILTSRAIMRGMLNFVKGSKDPFIEKNVYICNSCEHNVEETDKDMIVKDKQFPELSGRMCGDCGGCSLSFKTRQNIKPCRLWQK